MGWVEGGREKREGVQGGKEKGNGIEGGREEREGVEGGREKREGVDSKSSILTMLCCDCTPLCAEYGCRSVASTTNLRPIPDPMQPRFIRAVPPYSSYGLKRHRTARMV